MDNDDYSDDDTVMADDQVPESTDEPLTLESLAEQVDAIQAHLEMFGMIDPELAIMMFTFWMVVFVSGHGAGRVVRWLGKA